MGIESKAFDNEKVNNTQRTFGEVAEDKEEGGYYPVIRVKADGTKKPMMFTDADFDAAEKVAERNMEDMPEEDKSFWAELWG